VPEDPSDAAGIAGADREVVKTLEMIGKAQEGMEGFEASKMEVGMHDSCTIVA
jgi:hypothetical protein